MKTIKAYVNDIGLGYLQNNRSLGISFRDSPNEQFKNEVTITIPEPKKTKTVWQWRSKNSHGGWQVERRLLSESETIIWFEKGTVYEKHAGPFEVEE